MTKSRRRLKQIFDLRYQFSTRARNILHDAGVFSVEDLKALSLYNLVRVRGCGVKTAIEIARLSRKNRCSITLKVADFKVNIYPFTRAQFREMMKVCNVHPLPCELPDSTSL